MNAELIPAWDTQAPPHLSWEEKILYLAAIFHTVEQTETPVEHRFEPGVYVRTMRIPANTLFLGRRHREGHEVNLLEGEVVYMTPEGRHYVKPPFSIHTTPGFYAVFYTFTDVIGETRHPNPTGSRDTLELRWFDPAETLIARGQELHRRIQCQEP
jgi:hypothetical protein